MPRPNTVSRLAEYKTGTGRYAGRASLSPMRHLAEIASGAEGLLDMNTAVLREWLAESPLHGEKALKTLAEAMESLMQLQQAVERAGRKA